MIWLFTLKKARLENLKLIFLVILQIFYLKCHRQSSVKIEFRLVFMKFGKLKSCFVFQKLLYINFLKLRNALF